MPLTVPALNWCLLSQWGVPSPLHHPCFPASGNTISLLVNSLDSGLLGGKSVTQ